MQGIEPQSLFLRTTEKVLHFDFLSLEPLHKNTLKSTEKALKKPWKYLEKPMFILLGTLILCAYIIVILQLFFSHLYLKKDLSSLSSHKHLSAVVLTIKIIIWHYYHYLSILILYKTVFIQLNDFSLICKDVLTD